MPAPRFNLPDTPWSNGIRPLCKLLGLAIALVAFLVTGGPQAWPSGQPQEANTYTASAEFSVLAAGPVSPDIPTKVLIIFNAAVEENSANTATNYQLNGSPDFISAVRRGDAHHLVYLTLKPGKTLSTAAPMFIKASNIVDEQERPLSATGRNSNVFYFETVSAATEHILRCQLPDGALAMGHDTATWIAGQSLWIVPYFGQETLLGLLDAYAMAPDARYLAATRAFLSWYAGRMQADGTVTDYTGTYPDYTSTGTYDSSDSYAAGHLMLLWAYYQLSGDRAFVESLYPSVGRAVGAIELTLQNDWLTWAKPDYLVKYTMDNTEVCRGLEAAANLAELHGDVAHKAAWSAMAANVRAAIHSQLYLGDAVGYYSIGKFADGSLANSWAVYYPDGMAQCSVLNMLLDPSEPRAIALWRKTLELVAPGNIPMPELDFQFAWSAMRMGNQALTDIGYVLMQRNSNRYSIDSGVLLRFLRLKRSEQTACALWACY
jgi:hypothetical protein